MTSSKSAQHMKERSHSGVVVGIPPLHQGVGDALRTAFSTKRQQLPGDWEALLSKLN